MSINSYEELIVHHGHDVVVMVYAGDANVVIECLDCNEVLVSFDRDTEDSEKDIE